MSWLVRVAFLCVLCISVVKVFAVDREAFTFTSYDLTVRIEPDQHRLGVRGKITLRNDSPTPQKIAVLQISSSLDWRAIKSGDKPLPFVSQTFTSDIDHTGALSEAIVTLPEPVAPKAAIDLEIAYEGVIVLDATRLTRIGAPDAQANSSDWDQITPQFTAVRGAANVAWYPIATEAADLAETNSLSNVLASWRGRELNASMEIAFSSPMLESDASPPTFLCDGTETGAATSVVAPKWLVTKCSYPALGRSSPTFLSAGYQLLAGASLNVYSLPGHEAAAANFAAAAEKAAPFISEWFGKMRAKAQTADLADPSAAPFESGRLLLTPLASLDPKLAGMIAAHQLTHAAFFSPRPWIDEGLAHFAQALYLEHEKTRQAALDYMGLHRSAFSAAQEQTTVPRSEDEVNRSLVNTTDEALYRSKAMYVWWMLRDMLGDAALKKALAAYKPSDDKEPSYMPRLIQSQTQRDLEWFFDDWVYRDRGLPDFKISSAFPRKTLTNNYMLTVTVENLGGAGAEVPVTVKYAGGEVTRRLEVHGKDKASIRIEVPAAPQEVTVNDGSVPESDMTNNTFKIEAEAK